MKSVEVMTVYCCNVCAVDGVMLCYWSTQHFNVLCHSRFQLEYLDVITFLVYVEFALHVHESILVDMVVLASGQFKVFHLELIFGSS